MKNIFEKILKNNKVYKYVENQKEKLSTFSEITQSRFIGLAIFVVFLQLYGPIIASLKGFLTLGSIRAETIIAIIGIVIIFAEKSYEWFLRKTSYSFIFKMIILINSLWIVGGLLYFISPTYFIWWDSIIMIPEGLIYLAFMTANSNYIHYFESDDYTRANNFRNNLWLDISLIGLFLSALITYLLGASFSMALIIILNVILVVYQLNIVHLYEEKDFLYMLHYHRHLKNEKTKKENE